MKSSFVEQMTSLTAVFFWQTYSMMAVYESHVAARSCPTAAISAAEQLHIELDNSNKVGNCGRLDGHHVFGEFQIGWQQLLMTTGSKCIHPISTTKFSSTQSLPTQFFNRFDCCSVHEIVQDDHQPICSQSLKRLISYPR